MLRPASKLLVLVLALVLVPTRGAGAQAGAPPTLAQLTASKLGLSCSKVATGDTIVLQVTQNDSPYLRPDNELSAIGWKGVTLDLPTR